MTILILFGGESSERAVSLRSGEAVAAAARRQGHTVLCYDPADGPDGLKAALPGIDVVFPALHGAGGEDGSVQALLEAEGVPFVGSGSQGSADCFDKLTARRLMLAAGILVPAGEAVDKPGFASSRFTAAPYVLKPPRGGSSIDTFVVREPGRAIIDPSVFDRHTVMLLEQLVGGTELTVPVLGEAALPVIEIIPPEGKEFDYDNKYNGATRELCPPAHITPEQQTAAQALALRVHQSLGARHLSRTDMILTPAGDLVVLEINTMPGMTTESLFPKSARAAGIAMDEQIGRLLQAAAPSA